MLVLIVISILFAIGFTFLFGITIAYNSISYTKTPLWLEKIYDSIYNRF